MSELVSELSVRERERELPIRVSARARNGEGRLELALVGATLVNLVGKKHALQNWFAP